MKKFVFLMYGFEKPTPQIMEAWNNWFEKIGEHIIEKAHLPRGVELSHEGRKELPMAADSITGFITVNAQSLDEAEEMASTNPFVHSIRVYEVM